MGLGWCGYGVNSVGVRIVQSGTEGCVKMWWGDVCVCV